MSVVVIHDWAYKSVGQKLPKRMMGFWYILPSFIFGVLVFDVLQYDKSNLFLFYELFLCNLSNYKSPDTSKNIFPGISKE